MKKARKPMKPKDLRVLRKDYDQRYEVNYPPPTPRIATEQGQSSSIVLIIWGIVSLAGAIISLPHTLNAVGASVSEMDEWQKVGYAIAVFVGVELALLMVAFTQAMRQLENPRPRPIITVATLIASVLYRLGLRHRPTPPTSDNDGGIGGLLVMLLASALLFNLADTTNDPTLASITKTVSGMLAPSLLFLAGHEFAHNLAGKLLTGRIAQRENETAMEAWQTARDEAWRDYITELEAKPTTAKEVTTEKDPLVVTQTSLLPEWEPGDRANIPMTGNGKGNFIETKTPFLMKEKE
jgi:hypothetical protein